MPEIQVKNLVFSYPDRVIFKDLSLSLSGNGIYTLIGPSGSGKTTLFRLLLDLTKQADGGISLSEPAAAVFQEYRLFPHLTAAENVAVIRERIRESLPDAKALLCRLGFTDEDTELLPCELSGGMKQRVSIARALFSDSKILILDEPTKELDEALREVLYGLLKERAESSLILLSTHRTEETARLGAKLIELK